MLQDNIRNLTEFIKKVLSHQDPLILGLDINRTQTNILMTVDGNKDKSMTEISEIIGLEKSSFTRSVDHLVKTGFLIRNRIETDRREINLELTDKGIDTIEIIRKELDDYLLSLLENFSDKEKNEYLKSLQIVSKYIDKMLPAMD